MEKHEPWFVARSILDVYTSFFGITTCSSLPTGLPSLLQLSFPCHASCIPLDPASYSPSGSFGATPRAISELSNHYRNQSEFRPDPYILFAYPQLLDQSRAAIAKLLNVSIETCVFVPNATNGVHTVLRNIEWNQDGNDEVLYFNTIYSACGKSVTFVAEHTGLMAGRQISLQYPVTEKEVTSAFETAITASKADGKNPRLAIFDAVSSVPGVSVPITALLQICKANGILSMMDAAHGVGQIQLDLSVLQPDFLVSNCHKWLYAPRGCAVFYVPVKNQHIIRSTIPTSHGFVPRSMPNVPSPLGKNSKSAFVGNFEFTGTTDTSPYVVVAEAIKWRQEVCGGEAEIYDYCNTLVRRGAQIVSTILGTSVLANPNAEVGSSDDLQTGFLNMVKLPIDVSKVKGEEAEALQWMKEAMIREYKTFAFLTFWQGEFWTRLSGQIYLEDGDFEWTGEALKKVCEGVEKAEYKGAQQIEELAGELEQTAVGKSVE